MDVRLVDRPGWMRVSVRGRWGWMERSTPGPYWRAALLACVASWNGARGLPVRPEVSRWARSTPWAMGGRRYLLTPACTGSPARRVEVL